MWETEKDQVDRLIDTFIYYTMTIDNWKLKPYIKEKLVKRIAEVCNKPENTVSLLVEFMYAL
jgi:hypothetical protein